jgi:hypothetical protein
MLMPLPGRLIPIATLLALTVSCSGLTMKGYEGPGLPAQDVAVFNSGSYTHVERVDGTRVRSLYVNVAVPPGTHTIEVSFVRHIVGAKLLYPAQTATTKVFAEPGHRYMVQAEAIPGALWMGIVPLSFKWVAHVTDQTTGERVAETETLPLSVEPVWLQGYDQLPP